jgi:putative hemolysin
MDILLILVLVLLNGVFAMSELALVSARKSRLQQQAEEGNPGARAALVLLEHPSRLLSTVQVGITLVGTIAGVYGGQTLADHYLEPLLLQVPLLAPYATPIALALVVLAITYLSLVVGELVPKRLAMRNPERIAAVVSLPMTLLAQFAKPLVWLLTTSTETLLKLFGNRAAQATDVTEEEIKVLLDEGTRAGVFEEAEQEIVSSALGLGDRDVVSLMTPRHDIVFLDLEDSLEGVQELLRKTPLSRFPVIEGDPDRVLGIIRARDLLDTEITVEEVRKRILPAVVVPENMSALELLEQFKLKRTHLALVVDEYGSIQGLVTLHDILEAIVGEMPGSETEDESWVVRRDDGSFLIDGALPIEELKKLLDEDTLPEEEAFRTLGGFVLNQLGHIPRAAEVFDWNGWRIEVIDMDGNRVDKVLIQLNAPAREGGHGA